MQRSPKNLNGFYMFFIVYKLFYMCKEEKFLEFLEGKKYFSTEDIVSDIYEGRTLPAHKLSFVSTSILQKVFGLHSSVYAPYFKRWTKTFKEYVRNEKCRLFEWTPEAHKFFEPLVEAYFEGSFELPEDFKSMFYGALNKTNKKKMTFSQFLKTEPYYVQNWFNTLRYIHENIDEQSEITRRIYAKKEK